MIQFDNAVKRFNNLILSELKEKSIKCWIAGGAIRDYFAGIPHKTDYDLFFPDEQNFMAAKKYFTDNDASVKWESDNGIKVVYKGKTYDLVKKYFANPKDTIDAFDFTVSMFAVDSEAVYHGETSFIDLSKRQLMINKITYPASTLSRAFRYTKKGYGLCLGEMQKIILSIQEMPKEPNKDGEESPVGNEGEESSGDKFGWFFIGLD